jgi:hypothetical protein
MKLRETSLPFAPLVLFDCGFLDLVESLKTDYLRSA